MVFFSVRGDGFLSVPGDGFLSVPDGAIFSAPDDGLSTNIAFSTNLSIYVCIISLKVI